VAQWCEHCDRPVEGDVCEICGADVTPEAREPIPWRWRFFIVATVVYLIWRIYQLVSWLSH
jgi:predicted RNA-binding protein with PUA domain